MHIQLIAVDVDGTLVDSCKQISRRTENAIKEAADRGIFFAVCTGRSTREIKEIRQRLPQIRYGVTANGAYVVDLWENTSIFKRLLSMEDIRTIYGCLRDFDLMFELYTDDQVLVPEECLVDLDRYGVGNLKELVASSRTGVKEFPAFLAERNEGVGKVNLFFRNSRERDQAAQLAQGLPYYMTHQEQTNLEFTRSDTTKGTGLKKLAESLGLEKHNIMAIGDNDNDLPMLRYAGLPVAMENALESLKTVAAYVTKSNDRDGVACAIEQLVLSI